VDTITISDRLQCSTCNGTKKIVCPVCKGTKESAYVGVDVCELCDENGQQTCSGVGFEMASSVDQLIAWYAKGHRNFRGTKFPTDRRLSYKDLDLRGIDLSHSCLSQYP
jgi:DnaJ-class molecular chaperone